ncbi:hypothetical protein K413DRAFT_4644 [Clostridium sp. ASBs410]|nr:hypothetical protein K413DRAFT_4644 [Clostridium sp. ASBs410]
MIDIYGNVGEKWVQIKESRLGALDLKEMGSEFEIKDYYSVPHGYASIEYNGVLLFIPDNIFEKHFVKWSEYKQYYQLGDQIMINANGNLGTYTIEYIKGDGNCVTLDLKQDRGFNG